jgi:hypothetical protein
VERLRIIVKVSLITRGIVQRDKLRENGSGSGFDQVRENSQYMQDVFSIIQ